MLKGASKSIWTFDRAKERLEQLSRKIEDRKDGMQKQLYEGLTYGLNSNQGQQQKKPQAYRRPPQYFKNVEYDQDGKFLIMHHYGAAKYYRINIAILFLFLGVTLWNYVKNSQVFFGKEWLANIYLFAIQGAIVGLYVFSNRHIRSLHLLKGGQNVEITTYSNFGLTVNRKKTLDISQLLGNRLFGPSSMRVY